MACREELGDRKPHAHAAPRGRSERQRPSAKQRACCKVALRHAHCLAQDLGALPQRQARTPQPVVRGGWGRPPYKGLIIQGQVGPGDFRRPWHPGQRPGPPDQVVDQVLGPPQSWRGPWPELRPVADCVPRQGADESVPGVGVAGPRTRLVWEEGVPVARLVSVAGCHAGNEDRQVHVVKAVKELIQEPPVHPLRRPIGEIGPPSAEGRPLVQRHKVGDRRRRVAELRAPCAFGTFPLQAIPQDLDFVVVCRAAIGARGIGPHAVARHPGRCP